MDQAGHVEEVLPPDDGNEVVGQAQLHRLTVDGRRHKQQARLGTQKGQGW